MLLKHKLYTKIKGHGCTDGRNKRVYKKNEEYSSNNVTKEYMSLFCVIDSKENIDTET